MPMRATLLVLLLAAVAGVAHAADKRIALSTGPTLVIGWKEGWVVGTAPDDAPAGSVVFHGSDPKIWRVMIAPMQQHPTLTGDVGNLRIYVRNLGRALENGGLEVDHEQKPIDPASPRGFYVKAHDPNPKLHSKNKSDMFSDGYTGALNVGSRPLLFEIAWNAGGEKEAAAALAAMKTIRLQ